MPVVNDLVDELSREIVERIIDHLSKEVESWQMTENDNKACEPSMTEEQLEYFNRGVRSVIGLLELAKEGDL